MSARRIACPWILIACLCICASPTAAGIRLSPAEQERLIGQPERLTVWPTEVRLTGPRSTQQLVVTGHYAEGRVRDLSHVCQIEIDNPQVARLEAGGWLRAAGDGQAQLVVRVGAGMSVRVPVSVAGFGREQPVSFRHDLIAALNVAGCNMGACHGIPSGRGGFKLSLRGHNPAADFLELTHAAHARRTNRFDPAASLILKKGLGEVPHAGGRRLVSANPLPTEMIQGWLTEGMRDDPADLPAVRKLEVLPGHRVQTAPARWQQLAVLAHFADGTVRDVTRLTAFKSSDEALAAVDVNGLVEQHQVGEVAILCRYLDLIECVRLTYLEPQPGFAWTAPPAETEIDEHVFAKLKLLNLQPSEVCSDAEFVRRVHLDLCGIVPAPDEVLAFLNDPAPDKRARLVDALLERPEYADYWAYKWLDVLRSNRLTIQIKGSHAYRQWLRHRIVTNRPWNEVVTELLTASGSTFGNPPANYYRGAYNHGEPVARDPQGLAEATAQLFFGIRLQCAQCHNHPFERWTQDDYYQMAAWFARVAVQQDPLSPGAPKQPYPWQLRENALVVYDRPAGEVNHPQTGKPLPPKVPGLPAPAIDARGDRRAVLAAQVTSPDNPFFARSTVNRIWFHLLGRGIVDPPDDFRDSNPPANDALLDALAREFVASGFDLRHILRRIVNSRTYQLSHETNPSNRTDDKYFSHALVRRKRLSAEVLLDAICAATGTPESFTGLPEGTRAVQLPDGQVIYTGGQYASWDRHPFLKAFGQPAREAVCECEREGDLNLDRALEMKNGDFVLGKIRADGNRIGQLLTRAAPDAEIVRDLFLATLSRLPTEDETRGVLDHVRASADRRAAWEDVQWALLNTNEFLFRH